MTFTRKWIVPVLVLCSASPVSADDSVGPSLRVEVQKYLARYELKFLETYRAAEEARWRRATSGADDREPMDALRAAERAWAEFAGSIENIQLSRTFQRRGKQLVAVEKRQLKRIAFEAAGSPAIVPDLVLKRIAVAQEAESASRARALTIDGQLVSRAELDRILRTERDLALRRKAWESRQDLGQVEKPLLNRLRWLENEIVRSMGSTDAFAYRASEYGISVGELQRFLDGVRRELRPLQTELHTYLRYELARVFDRAVPDAIPAHWLPAEGGAEALVEWLGLRSPLSERAAPFVEETPRSFVERADLFWQSLGFSPLPADFYARSVFGPSPSGETFLVSHVDRSGDVRAIFDTTSDPRGWLEAQWLVGQANCALLTARADVPIVLRRGPNRAFHAALAGSIALGASHARSPRSAGFSVTGAEDEFMSALLVEALDIVMPIAHSAGTLFQFERELYHDEIDPNTWNARWWQAMASCEGIAPPAPRDERWCDPAAEPGLFRAPAQGYDDAVAHVIAFELYDHIARKLLDADVHDVDFYGRRAVGDFIKSIARFGATVDWRTKLREKIGYEISARPIVEYFEPLRTWLSKRNEGRKVTLSRL
jgi:peptidyl-dipeptidase A